MLLCCDLRSITFGSLLGARAQISVIADSFDRISPESVEVKALETALAFAFSVVSQPNTDIISRTMAVSAVMTMSGDKVGYNDGRGVGL